MWYLGYLLYLISTNSYFLIVKIISPFNKRAKLFVEGRKDLIELITKKIIHDSRKSIWFQVSQTKMSHLLINDLLEMIFIIKINLLEFLQLENSLDI